MWAEYSVKIAVDLTITSYFRIGFGDGNSPELIKHRRYKMSNEVMNKEQWVLLFREIGLDEATMTRWHTEFEARYPDGHQSFLEWLQIPQDEIGRIRAL
jgi:hypothetical protein